MKRLLLVAIATLACLASARVYGHHGFATSYMMGKTVTIEGTLLLFNWRNPHSFVYVRAKDDKGVDQRWAIEWGGAGQLRRQGIEEGTLKPGDKVIITGDAAREPGAHRLKMRTLFRPADGFRYGGEFD